MWSLPALLIFFESTAAVNWWLPSDQGEAQSVCGGGKQGGKRRPPCGSGSWGGGLRQGLKVGHQCRGVFEGGQVTKVGTEAVSAATGSAC